MDRLTDHTLDNFNEPGCNECSAYCYACCKENNDVENCNRRLIYNKLSKFEDLEEQDLLIELPKRIGDIVYTIRHTYIFNQETKQYVERPDCIYEYKITNIQITQNKKGKWTKKYKAMRLVDGKIINYPKRFEFSDIEESIFNTREGAEHLLSKGNNNG